FTDCCPLLVNRPGEEALYDRVLQHARERRWRSIEYRGNARVATAVKPSLEFLGHTIDLSAGPDSLFSSFDSSMRRGIRKARQAGLRVEFSDTSEAVGAFYSLHCSTRRRHGLPPQPFRFFRNIARYVIESGHGFVVTAFLDRLPIASAVFFHHHEEAIYKFGASNFEFQSFRPNNLLMWEAISRYSKGGFKRLHLGRTSLNNEGLRRFKLGLGASEEWIHYYKYDVRLGRYVADVDRSQTWANRIFPLLPPALSRLAGELLYPHLS